MFSLVNKNISFICYLFNLNKNSKINHIKAGFFLIIFCIWALIYVIRLPNDTHTSYDQFHQLCCYQIVIKKILNEWVSHLISPDTHSSLPTEKHLSKDIWDCSKNDLCEKLFVFAILFFCSSRLFVTIDESWIDLAYCVNNERDWNGIKSVIFLLYFRLILIIHGGVIITLNKNHSLFYFPLIVESYQFKRIWSFCLISINWLHYSR